MYNPFDGLLLLRRHEFEAHWFETGTPAFLVDTLFERRVSTVSVGDMVSTGELLATFDVDHIGTEALLLQTGYLTITGEERLGGKALYRLGYRQHHRLRGSRRLRPPEQEVAARMIIEKSRHIRHLRSQYLI